MTSQDWKYTFSFDIASFRWLLTIRTPLPNLDSRGHGDFHMQDRALVSSTPSMFKSGVNEATKIRRKNPRKAVRKPTVIGPCYCGCAGIAAEQETSRNLVAQPSDHLHALSSRSVLTLLTLRSSALLVV